MPIDFRQMNNDMIELNGHEMSLAELSRVLPSDDPGSRVFGSCQADYDGDACERPFLFDATDRKWKCKDRGHPAGPDWPPTIDDDIKALLAGIDWNQILDQHKLDALVGRLQVVRQQAVVQQAVVQQAVEHIVIERDPHVLDDVLQQLQNHGGGLANGGHQ